SRTGSILDVACDMGIIEKRGSWFSFGDEQLAQGREAVKALLAETPDLVDRLYTKIKEKLAEKNGTAEAEAPEAAADNQ
ncbi:MAG: hypothetical protein J6Q65_01740, partial [Lentisphaeria bacterium]|nr:hypothetical protein [Lentisphaeria bacterium]